jgi:hypothetical protein
MADNAYLAFPTVSAGSLRRSGLQMMATVKADNATCSRKPVLQPDGKTLAVPALSRDCITLITGITDPNHILNSGDRDNIVKWLQGAKTWGVSDSAIREYINVIWARDFNDAFENPSKRLKDVPDVFTIVANATQATIDSMQKTVESMGDIFGWITDPKHWIGMIAIAVGAVLLVFSAPRVLA